MTIISSAMAATQAVEPQASPMGSIIMMLGFLLIFYFLIWRPQSQRAKEHRELVSGIAKGDEVITNGGLVGKVTKVSDDFVHLTIAENTSIICQKSAVSASLPKGTIKSI